MLLGYGFKNFYSFREGAEVSFEYGRATPSEITDGTGVGIVLGIKGANGSGKTNVIKALSFIKSFARSFADKPQDQDIFVESFFFSEEPSEFFIEFLEGGIRYLYEFGVTSKEVIFERLYKTVSRKTRVFERKLNTLIYTQKNIHELKRIKLRSNASVLGAFSNFIFNQDMIDLNNSIRFFASLFGNVSEFGYHDYLLVTDYKDISEFLKRDDEGFAFVKDLITKADLGISDIKIESRMDENDEETFFPVFFHPVKGRSLPILFQYESKGTQQLYKTLYTYWVVLQLGATLVMDEFDIHLHSHILPYMLDLFMNPAINKKRAQFIFTAHNTEILEKLTKYRTILVNKDENESYCYRLDEMGSDVLRNDRRLTLAYESGKIGGVPKL